MSLFTPDEEARLKKEANRIEKECRDVLKSRGTSSYGSEMRRLKREIKTLHTTLRKALNGVMEDIADAQKSSDDEDRLSRVRVLQAKRRRILNLMTGKVNPFLEKFEIELAA